MALQTETPQVCEQIFNLEKKYQSTDTVEMLISRIATSFDGTEEERTILLTGTIAQEKIHEVKKAIEEDLKEKDIKITCIDNPAYSPSAVYDAHKENVIIVEENNITRHAELNKLLNALAASKSSIVGCIVI